MNTTSEYFDTSQASEWRSIVTLIVFILANYFVIFPLYLPCGFLGPFLTSSRNILSSLRITSPRHDIPETSPSSRFPLDYVTAPLLGNLFLLSISAIGRKEIRDGTIGANDIYPIDIVMLSLLLGYISVSIEQSGFLNYMVLKVLMGKGRTGHLLFLSVSVSSFVLSSFMGNETVILSATAFLVNMTKVSKNHPRAWIYDQLVTANIGATILVSSSPTNLIVAETFQIQYIRYAANVVVPVVASAIVLVFFMLYSVFADTSLIPEFLEIETLSQEERCEAPINRRLQRIRGRDRERGTDFLEEEQAFDSSEVLNPFLDKIGALFGTMVLIGIIVTLLALDASTISNGQHTVFWVALPGAALVFLVDVARGWYNRRHTREIARDFQATRAAKREELPLNEHLWLSEKLEQHRNLPNPDQKKLASKISIPSPVFGSRCIIQEWAFTEPDNGESSSQGRARMAIQSKLEAEKRLASQLELTKVQREVVENHSDDVRNPRTLAGIMSGTRVWLQETFPTATITLSLLPFELIPFTLSMFIIVQALVSNGWVPVFARGWDVWVDKTGTVGAVAGMGFLSVILCNFAATNLGSTIILSRILQAWQEMHRAQGTPIGNRTLSASIYSLAIGANYGGSSVGLLWRRELRRRKINVCRMEFARVTFPLITSSMVAACAVLVGQVYITRNNSA